MRVSEIGRLCLFGRREWKTGCGQDVVVVIIKTNEERRMPLRVRNRKNNYCEQRREWYSIQNLTTRE